LLEKEPVKTANRGKTLDGLIDKEFLSGCCGAAEDLWPDIKKENV
jgi:hypothetical protein